MALALVACLFAGIGLAQTAAPVGPLVTYEVKAPNGKTYDVNAKVGATLSELAQAVIALHPEANSAKSAAEKIVTYKLQAPNGKVYKFEGPAGATHKQQVDILLQRHPEANIARPTGSSSVVGTPYSIRMPDGTTIANIPNEMSFEEAKAQIAQKFPQYASSAVAPTQASRNNPELQTATVQPSTTSMPLADTNLSSAVTSALFATAVGIFAAILLQWLITRHLWRKPRLTPHQNGLWFGSWIASLSLALGVQNLVGLSLTVGITPSDWYKFGLMWSFTLPIIYFLMGYAAGWVFRRLKPLVGKTAVGAPANTPAPSRTPMASSHQAANFEQIATPAVAREPTRSTPKPQVTTSDEESIYEQALTELSANKKPGLWAMALAQTANGGNPDGAYIALRVEQLKQEKLREQQQGLADSADIGTNAKPISSVASQEAVVNDGKLEEALNSGLHI